MTYQEIIELGLKLGLEEIELYDGASVSNKINVFKGKVDTYTISDTRSLSIRGKYNGQMGYATTEDFSDEAITKCLEMVLTNAKYLSTPEPDFMFEGNCEYVEVHNPEADFNQVSFEDKVNFLKNLEAKLQQADPRIVNVEVTYMERASRVSLVNSKGLNVSKSNSYMVFYASALAVDGENASSKFAADVNVKFAELDADKVYNKLVKEVLDSLNAGFVETGKYPIVLTRDTATSILRAFTSSIFSGISAMRKMTILVDKIGQKVFGDNITLINDPFTNKALFKESFDDEGVPCKYKEVVKDGVFTGFFHNLRSAKFFNQAPTGNGYRSGAGTNPTPVNLYLKEGSLSQDEIIKTIDKGLLITEVSGLHAGLNPISGNFNVQSSGFLIENGQITKPVTLFVLSSNFYEMMNNVECIGNDLEPNFDGVASPCLKIKEVQISGK